MQLGSILLVVLPILESHVNIDQSAYTYSIKARQTAWRERRRLELVKCRTICPPLQVFVVGNRKADVLRISSYEVELLIGTRGSRLDSRVRVHFKGLARLAKKHSNQSKAQLKPGMSFIGPGSPRVPASPGKVSPRIQKVGLLPVLLWSLTYDYLYSLVWINHFISLILFMEIRDDALPSFHLVNQTISNMSGEALLGDAACPSCLPPNGFKAFSKHTSSFCFSYCI